MKRKFFKDFLFFFWFNTQILLGLIICHLSLGVIYNKSIDPIKGLDFILFAIKNKNLIIKRKFQNFNWKILLENIS